MSFVVRSLQPVAINVSQITVRGVMHQGVTDRYRLDLRPQILPATATYGDHKQMYEEQLFLFQFNLI